MGEAEVSPLIIQPSEFVRLHFELAADGTLTSPQVPSKELQELAIHNGAPLSNIETSCVSLNELSEAIQHDELAEAVTARGVAAVRGDATGVGQPRELDEPEL